jgi:hypothetical protein
MRAARVAIPAVLTSMTDPLGASRTMMSSSGAQPSSGKMYVIELLGAATAPPLPRGPSLGVIALYATVVGGARLLPAVIPTAGRRPKSLMVPRSLTRAWASRAESLRDPH